MDPSQARWFHHLASIFRSQPLNASSRRLLGHQFREERLPVKTMVAVRMPTEAEKSKHDANGLSQIAARIPRRCSLRQLSTALLFPFSFLKSDRILLQYLAVAERLEFTL
jgi:hypothetical protein